MNSTDGSTIFDALRAPFPVNRIHWRVGATTKDKDKGIALAYIDARDAQQRLDEVMGVDWQCRYSHVSDKGVVCEVGLYVNGEWRWRANGAGETDYEATKGAMSDAFKRACVMWGVGKYLYALPNEWVPIKPAGRSYKIENPPKLPPWATPEHYWKSIGGLKHSDAVRGAIATIAVVKEHIRTDPERAAEAYAELTRDEERALDKAPTRGGAAWDTEERKIIGGEEFQRLVHVFRSDAGWYDREENKL